MDIAILALLVLVCFMVWCTMVSVMKLVTAYEDIRDFLSSGTGTRVTIVVRKEDMEE